MKPKSPLKLVLGGLAAATASAAVTLAIINPGNAQPETGTAQPAAVVQTAFPGLEAASGEPNLASINQARPQSGEVVQATGPFDQRLVFENLVFDGSTVSGEVLITSDVSELLALQVLAGFYDGQGNLLGTERFVHHVQDDGHAPTESSEPEEFEILVPKEYAGNAVSAAVGVPVLVNE